MRAAAEQKVQKKVLDALRAVWPGPGERRVLAVSGGVDSMVLLEGMARLCKGAEDRSRLSVVHVNHGLRGEESEGDEALVAERAARLGIAFQSFRLEWENEQPTQNACRKKRDAIFSGLCTSDSDKVLLAHHLNDQAETVFFRLMRGTGARGLKGMLPASGYKLRPFLSLEKAVLVEVARAWNVKWREDRSNQDKETYERNWLRGLFPLIEARRPGFQNKLAALAEEARSWRVDSSGTLSLFPWADGLSFARPVGVVDAGLLSEQFRLNRQHSRAVEELLRKPSGRWEAEKARFTWSGGVLLVERGRRWESKTLAEDDGRFESHLGSWEFPSGTRLVEREERKHARKDFQALRVPVFFRDSLPLLRHKGRARVLMPARVPGILRYAPSDLARWWLSL
ncbi:MAG TPA: tRNA lysidine(34) synthetase TilS [Bdellovibrionota bacterium]|jgi:tRNA(Ile)-lysidine synthetase-like protein